MTAKKIEEITQKEWNHFVGTGNGKCLNGCGFNYTYGIKGGSVESGQVYYGYICPKCDPDNERVKTIKQEILKKREWNAKHNKN